MLKTDNMLSLQSGMYNYLKSSSEVTHFPYVVSAHSIGLIPNKAHHVASLIGLSCRCI